MQRFVVGAETFEVIKWDKYLSHNHNPKDEKLSPWVDQLVSRGRTVFGTEGLVSTQEGEPHKAISVVPGEYIIKNITTGFVFVLNEEDFYSKIVEKSTEGGFETHLFRIESAEPEVVLIQNQDLSILMHMKITPKMSQLINGEVKVYAKAEVNQKLGIVRWLERVPSEDVPW